MGSQSPARPVKVGIIGGSGLEDASIFAQVEEKWVTTPYGKPSDALHCGELEGVSTVILSRHDRRHSLTPTQVNYRANIWALYAEGCTHILTTNACGSLREEIKPGELAIVDQFIDMTKQRPCTFYDGTPGGLKGVCHIPMAQPYCKRTRQHAKATMLVIEGPRFSSRAESLMFRTMGGDVIGMTAVPEVCLANELGMCMAAIGLTTDYDCWRDDEYEPVNVEMVMKTFGQNKEAVLKLIRHVVPLIAKEDWTELLKEQHLRAVNANMTK